MAGKHTVAVTPGVTKKTSHLAAYITLGTVAALTGVSLAFCLYANLYTGIFPGVTGGGRVDLAGLTKEEAIQKMERDLPALLEETTVQMELEGEVFAEYSMADIGMTPQSDTMADSAYAVGREEFGLKGWFSTGVAFLKGLLGMEQDISLDVGQDQKQVDTVVSQLAQQVDRAPVDASYEMKEDGLYATKHTDGRALDQEALRTQLTQLTLGEPALVKCSVTPIPAQELDVEAMVNEVSKDPTPARYDVAQGKAVDGSVGIVIEADAVRYIMDSAAQGETVQLPIDYTYPEMTAEELQAVLFRDLLGTSTTNVGGTSARRGNVKLAGQEIHGLVLNDGEVFNFNKVVGERTAARGFGAAATYVNGMTVDTIGGGICQVSSTVYLASLLSNLEIVERYNHRYYPGYITLGMDATVSWGGPEFRFKNNTGYPIRIDVIYQNSKLTVNIYGTKTDDTYVKMTHEVLSTTKYEREYVETTELAAGVQKQQQSGYTGYKVKTYRNVYDGSGNLISSNLEATSNYSNRNEIILVGTASQPAAEVPTEEPTLPPT